MAFKGADAPAARDPPRPVRPGLRHRHRQRPGPGAGLRRAQERRDRHHRGRHREAGGRALDGRVGRGLLAARAGASRPTARARSRRPPRSRGSGHDRTLAYTVKNLPKGSRVEFAEAGDGGGGRIGIVTADGARHAGVPPGRRRARQARRSRPSSTAPTASSPAAWTSAPTRRPAPERPAKATKLTAKRSGKKLVLRWRGKASTPAGRHPQQHRAEPHPHGQALDDLDRPRRRRARSS